VLPHLHPKALPAETRRLFFKADSRVCFEKLTTENEMVIEIKNRFSGSVIFSHEQEGNTIKIALELALKSRANLYGANLSGANLYGANLSRADLSGANLYGANLSRADLSGANLYGANLSRADLSGANLYGANLYGADLYGANLYGANLSRADLSGANLYGADLYGANLYGANLYGANLYGATYGIATLKNGLLQLLGKYWPVYIFDAHIKIGCQFHSTEEWDSFTDDQISNMAGNALEFWKENKEIILMLAKHHQKLADEVGEEKTKTA
jgi:uncharacterized protein YjbI with pentapeptide repeats